MATKEMIQEIDAGEEFVVYRGGQHIVVCDGLMHWQIYSDGTRLKDCLCKNWAGEHQKGKPLHASPK